MEGAWEAADELTRNVLENWDTNQIHDAGYREELKRQLELCISVCGRTVVFRMEIYSFKNLKNRP